MNAEAAARGFEPVAGRRPNCGKTALFNRLTGSRQKVANYPGVTVERKEGRFIGPRSGRTYRVLDLPGAYSLEPTTLDEAITRDVVLGRHACEPPPDLIVCVVDATNLRLNLRLVLELKRLRPPLIVALEHERSGAASAAFASNRAALARAIGVPVVETVAVRAGGERALVERIDRREFAPHARDGCTRCAVLAAEPTSRRRSAKCAGSWMTSAIACRCASRCSRGWMPGAASGRAVRCCWRWCCS